MYIPNYQDCYMIDQYHIQSPGTVCRIQEDAMALISLEQYLKYIYDNDVKINIWNEI